MTISAHAHLPTPRRAFREATTANRILRIAEQHPSFKQPKSWKQYADAFNTAMTMMNEPPPVLDGLANDKAEAIIRNHAKALAEHHALVQAAEDAALYANDSLAVESKCAVDEVIGFVSNAFDAALVRFKAVNRDAPEILSGYETAEAVEAYQARQRAAFELVNLMAQRIEIGRAVDESGVVPDYGLWCLLEAPGEDVKPAALQTWFNVVRSVADIFELSPVARIRIFVERELPLSIPARGQAESRRRTWETARNNVPGEAQLTVLGEMQRREALGLPVPAGL